MTPEQVFGCIRADVFEFKSSLSGLKMIKTNYLGKTTNEESMIPDADGVSNQQFCTLPLDENIWQPSLALKNYYHELNLDYAAEVQTKLILVGEHFLFQWSTDAQRAFEQSMVDQSIA